MWGFLFYALGAFAASAFAASADVLYLVISDERPESAAARQSCRQTWLQFTLPRRHFFCVAGAPTAATTQEELEQGDLIHLASDVDGYRGLSQKVLACFREVTLRAGTFDFMVKTDHDVFLRADVLQRELSDTLARLPGGVSTGDFWRGFVYRDMPPLRDLREKNADTELTLMTLPPYTSGVAYILSAGLLQGILALPQHLFILNEDQGIGFWAAQLGGIQPVHDVRFQSFHVCSPSQLSFHPMTPASSQRLMANIVARQPLCSGAEMRGWGSCCLCCSCQLQPFDQLSCSAEGARFRGHYALSTLLHVPALSLSKYSSSKQLAGLVSVQAPWLLESRQFPLGNWQSTKPGLLAILNSNSQGRVQHGVQFSCALQPAAGKDAPCFAWLDTHVEQIQKVSWHSSGPRCAPVCRHSLSLNNGASAPPPTVQGWVLISANVDTHGACDVASLGSRHNLISPTAAEQGIFLGRNGAFGAFCGLFIDAYHEDGTISTLQTPFARNSPSYLHHDLLALSSNSTLTLVRLTLIIPMVPKVAVTVADVSVTQLISERFAEFQPPLHQLPDVRPRSIRPCIKKVLCAAASTIKSAPCPEPNTSPFSVFFLAIATLCLTCLVLILQLRKVGCTGFFHTGRPQDNLKQV